MPVEAVLVSNGPGELYTWAYPVYKTIRELQPDWKISISLIPCQYASGKEAEIAATFGADGVSTPQEFLTYTTTGKRPAALGDETGFVISLGGNQNMALQLGRRLGYPTYSYKFVPAWNKDLKRLFVHDEIALKKARRLGVPEDRLELIGNLVADAVDYVAPAVVSGSPQILLMAGTRDGFSIFLIPFIIAVADYLHAYFPNASFVWPVSRLLSEQTIREGIAGKERAILEGMGGSREGQTILTPSGAKIVMIEEHERHAHMRSADLAITIPGTNTLELGIAGLPSIVILPMNKPEAIPLDGLGHWLGLIPLVGKYIKRHAVKLFVEGLDVPVSLPNRTAGEDLMLELKGKITAQQVASEARQLLEKPELLVAKRERLLVTMPKAGAAKRLIESILNDLNVA